MIPVTRNPSTARSHSITDPPHSERAGHGGKPIRSHRPERTEHGRDRRPTHLPRQLAEFGDPQRTPLVHAIGEPFEARIEQERDPERIDHVWITIDTGPVPRLVIAINTLSFRNGDAGFDARVRVGLVRDEWLELPHRIIEPWDRFDYSEIEADHNVYCEALERIEIEERLMELTSNARLIEVWGTPYRNRGIGLHQIHSRRASCAVPEDLVGRDGALRFYGADGNRLMLLFKFCGQP